MSNKLPLISGEKAIKAFTTAGWHFDRMAGSHAILRKGGNEITLSVPLHDELRKGLLRALIKTLAWMLKSSWPICVEHCGQSFSFDLKKMI